MTTTLSIAVVGHTNTGKTSLLRTLTRDSHFGQVADQAGTTRHVEQTVFSTEVGDLLWRDTPGLEDSSALYQTLHQHRQLGTPRDQLARFVQDAAFHPEFEQEIKVLTQLLDSDVLLYVIDCREPWLGKYHDELRILLMAAKPILPVLNFLHAEHPQQSLWLQHLAELGLHAHVAFDTVAFDFEAERRLYQKLQTLAEPHYRLIQTWIDTREAEWRNLIQAACARVSECLFEASALEANANSADQSQASLQNQARAIEQQCLQDLLALMRFSSEEVRLSNLPVKNGAWQLDLFSKETLKTLGLESASAAATGAAIGVGIDLMFAGMSLGAATALGATLGTAYATSKRFGKRLWQRSQGIKPFYLDDTTLDALLLRSLWVLRALLKRGHAALTPDKLDEKTVFSRPSNWPDQRRTLRASALGMGQDPAQAKRQLALALEHWLAPEP